MTDRLERAGWLAVAACAALALVAGRLITRAGAERLPQVPGENVLALVLGDARQQLSAALFDKVEEYFHGGVQCVACEHGLAVGEAHEHELEHEHEHENENRGAARPWDPWSRLNARVHVQEHRHLEGQAEAAEMLPWVWAACRASPQNTQAFLAGSYVLSHMMGRENEAVRLLKEGVAANPACAELDFSLGELYFNRLRDLAQAEAWFRSAADKYRPAEGEAGEEARRLKVRALFYLGHIAKGRGDLARLRTYVRAAEATEPEYVSTRDLRALLRAAEEAERAKGKP